MNRRNPQTGPVHHGMHGEREEHEEFPSLEAAAPHAAGERHDARERPDAREHHDAHPHDEDACAIDATAGPRRIGFGVLLFVAIAIAAVLSLWFMRSGLRAGADATKDTDAGKLVESFLAERGAAQAVRRAAPRHPPLGLDDVARVQVPAAKLARNPFRMPARVEADATNPADGVGAADGAPGAAVEGVGDVRGDAAPTLAGRVAEWEREVDASAADFRIESVLVGSNPRTSVVSMNGGVFRVGDGVMFPDRAVHFVLESIEPGVITLRARNDELGCDRVIAVEVRRRR